MRQVSLDQSKEHLPELVNSALHGEEILIQQNENQFVRLVPYTQSKKKPQFGSAKGLIEMTDDFDAPLSDC